MLDAGVLKQWLISVALLASLTAVASAQSTDQSFPSPIPSNELSGTINAKDVGDARLTTYYYVFDAMQGDLFVNFLTKNFTGDIDIFILEGLRPLSKVVIYADLSETETGRVLYLRKRERLMMRIQGRTPGDDPATYKVKFAGSFQAISDTGVPSQPDAPKVTSATDTNVRVNSVGTILEIIPKAVPVKTEKAEETVASAEPKMEPGTNEPKAEAPKAETPAEETQKKVEVVVTENISPAVTEPTIPAPTTSRRRRGTPSAPRPVRGRTTGTTKAPPLVRRSDVKKDTESPAEKAPDPLANIQLVIEFKDGRNINRPMSEVFRFTVDKGVLTVISKDGSIGRYSLLDVTSVTIK